MPAKNLSLLLPLACRINCMLFAPFRCAFGLCECFLHVVAHSLFYVLLLRRCVSLCFSVFHTAQCGRT